MFLALEGFYDNPSMNAVANVFNSQLEYFIATHGYNGCPQYYSINGFNNKQLM